MSRAMHMRGLKVAEDHAPVSVKKESSWSRPSENEFIILKPAKAHASKPDSPKPQVSISSVLRQTSVLCQIDEVMVLCSNISDNTQIKAAVDSSAKGAAVAAGGAFLGGLLGGPPGIFIGGAVGSAVGWLTARGKFRPLHQIIKEMNPKEKKELYSEVLKVLGTLAFYKLADLTSIVMSNAGLQREIADVLISFVKNKLRAKVKCGKK